MDKKTLSAIFLIFLVIMFYQFVLIPRVAPPPPPSVEEETAPPGVAPAAQAPPEAAALSETTPPDTLLTPAGGEPVDVSRESVDIETDYVRTTVDNLRGGLTRWELSGYTWGADAKEFEGKPLDLVRPGALHGTLGITFLDPTAEEAFSSPLSIERDGGTLVLQGRDPYGLWLTRRYNFDTESYDVEMQITLENRGDSPRNAGWEVIWGPGLGRVSGKGLSYRQENIAFAFGELDKVKVKDPGQKREVGTVSWLGIGNRYFLAALVSGDEPLTGFVRKRGDGEDEIGLKPETSTLMPGQSVSHTLRAYVGPKERDRLRGYGVGLERAINYGWFSWLALPFLSILKFTYRYLHNYGLAILALTVLVKLALFPITQKMYRSMRKMQTLQPQIQAIRKKHKDDSQAVQRETMELYRQYRVNPMAGCLPMVIQIPVFFALYRVLFNAIELRGAGFLYIHDLSQKDPYYITPVLMGITMILQQRMSPTSVDPKQAKMMMFMPIIFTAMFINFSSGLVLYFLFSNVISIGEQHLIRKWSARQDVATLSPAPAEGKDSVGKKRSRKRNK